MNYNKINQQSLGNTGDPDLKEESKAIDEVTVTKVESKIIKATVNVKDPIKLNIRKEPKGGSEIVCVVKSGTSLIIGKTKDNWTEVYTKDGSKIEGYVMSQYLKVNKE